MIKDVEIGEDVYQNFDILEDVVISKHLSGDTVLNIMYNALGAFTFTEQNVAAMLEEMGFKIHD